MYPHAHAMYPCITDLCTDCYRRRHQELRPDKRTIFLQSLLLNIIVILSIKLTSKQIDTRHISTPSSIDVIPGINIDNDLLKTGFNMTSEQLGLADFYTSSLWNSCSGKVNGGNWDITECGSPSATYFFNPIQILNSSAAADAPDIEFPDSIKKINKAVGAVSKVMNAMYILGFVTTVATFAIGWFGLLSRWGSCVTTILADVCFALPSMSRVGANAITGCFLLPPCGFYHLYCSLLLHGGNLQQSTEGILRRCLYE